MNMPPPFAKQYWSHGGITPEIREEIEKILGDGVVIAENPRQRGEHHDELISPKASVSQNIKQTKEGIWVLANDSHISRWVEEKGQLQHDFQLLPEILPLIPVGGTVIDVGANIGDTTGPFLERVGPTGRVISFEPNPDAFECLKRNCPAAITVNYALGDENKHAGMAFCENAGANYVTKNGGEVCVATLDTILKIGKIRLLGRLDFIKIDVEGYELKVLKGAAQTIDKFRPLILLEINETALKRQGTNQAAIYEWLTEHDYRGYPMNKPNLEQDAPQYDILCKPNEKKKGGDVPTCHTNAESTEVITHQESAQAVINAAPKSDPDSAADIIPWANRKESIAEIDRLACKLKRFCTAPRSTLVVRERLRKIRVITKVR